MLAAPPSPRTCPACGAQTEATYCPHDGVLTMVQPALKAQEHGLPVGFIVADRYRVTGHIGVGGFGSVYAAEHVGTGQAIAIKTLRNRTDGASNDDVSRFFREARATEIAVLRLH